MEFEWFPFHALSKCCCIGICIMWCANNFNCLGNVDATIKFQILRCHFDKLICWNSLAKFFHFNLDRLIIYKKLQWLRYSILFIMLVITLCKIFYLFRSLFQYGGTILILITWWWGSAVLALTAPHFILFIKINYNLLFNIQFK